MMKTTLKTITFGSLAMCFAITAQADTGKVCDDLAVITSHFSDADLKRNTEPVSLLMELGRYTLPSSLNSSSLGGVAYDLHEIVIAQDTAGYRLIANYHHLPYDTAEKIMQAHVKQQKGLDKAAAMGLFRQAEGFRSLAVNEPIVLREGTTSWQQNQVTFTLNIECRSTPI